MKRIDLSKIQSKFRELVEKYLKENDMTQQELADIVDIQRPNLNHLLKGNRKLSAYYLLKFIRTGVVRVEDVSEYKSDNPREKEFWKVAEESQNYKMLVKIADLRQSGIDIDSIIEQLHKSIQKK